MHSTSESKELTLSDDSQRISELESRLEFQDETITRLNDALVAQQNRLDQLEKRQQQLVEHLQSTQAKDDPAKEPPPPHY
ncbi:MAG: SlyX protein [Gammaproteobacteria bacterium]|nr:SlyX protein [Gammaproteobacteria bacterium]